MTLDLSGAKGMLLNVTTGPEITLGEMTEAADIIQTTADVDAQVIWGHVIDESLGDKVHVTLIATFPEGAAARKTSGTTLGGSRVPGAGAGTGTTTQVGGRQAAQPVSPRGPIQQPVRPGAGGGSIYDWYKGKREKAQSGFEEASLSQPSEDGGAFPGQLRRSYDQPAIFRKNTRN